MLSAVLLGAAGVGVSVLDELRSSSPGGAGDDTDCPGSGSSSGRSVAIGSSVVGLGAWGGSAVTQPARVTSSSPQAIRYGMKERVMGWLDAANNGAIAENTLSGSIVSV